MVALPASGGVADAQAVQRELADSSRRLSAILDEDWRKYLAMPAEVYGTDRLPSVDLLRQSLNRFDRVATNPQYPSAGTETRVPADPCPAEKTLRPSDALILARAATATARSQLIRTRDAGP